jgi:hypothetical protein
MSDPKRPSLNWYPGDHQRDTGIKACAFEPRGLWREMMDLMHDGEPYGHLTAGGIPIMPLDLSRIIGIPLLQVNKYLKELEDRKVFSRTTEGVIFSRRMVRDAETRRTKKRNGKLGGNPRLLNHEDNRQDIHPLNQLDNHHVSRADNLSPPRAASAVAVAVATAPPPPLARDEAQSPTGSTAQTLVSVVPAEFRPDMKGLLALVPNVTAWTAEMRSALEGMHGKPLTFAQLGQAVRDYLASGKVKNPGPSLRSFRRYMQGVLEVSETLPRTNGAAGKRGGPKEYDYSKSTDTVEEIKWQT